MSEKQEWVYTEDGPVLDDKKRQKMPKVKLRKIYFILPWILLLAMIIWSFAQGGSLGVTGGIVLVIVGPISALIINFLTFYYLAIRPLKKMAQQNMNNNPKIQR